MKVVAWWRRCKAVYVAGFMYEPHRCERERGHAGEHRSRGVQWAGDA